MDIIAINFGKLNKLPSNVQNDTKIQLLNELKRISKAYLYTCERTNNLKYTDERKRLLNLEVYINQEYHLDINIYYIIRVIIDAIEYNKEKTRLVINNNIKFKNVYIVDLFQLITYGTVSCRGSKFIIDCLTNSFTILKAKTFLYTWRWIK